MSDDDDMKALVVSVRQSQIDRLKKDLREFEEATHKIDDIRRFYQRPIDSKEADLRQFLKLKLADKIMEEV